MEALLQDAARLVALALQGIAIVMVAIGSATVLVAGVRLALASRRDDVQARALWHRYARWLVAALTFQLGADIVGTSFAPAWDEIGRLAAVAAIRTFLSYFLDHEIESSRKLLPQASAPPDMSAGSPAAKGEEGDPTWTTHPTRV